MIKLDDLFFAAPEGVLVEQTPVVNPFTDKDALLEAQILDVRHNGVRSTLGILLELRMAYHVREASTGLIVASRMTSYSWEQVDRADERTAFTIYGSTPNRIESSIGFELTLTPNAKLRFTAGLASFYVLRIEGLEHTAPPDYGDPDFARIRSSIATWDSIADVVGSVSS